MFRSKQTRWRLSPCVHAAVVLVISVGASLGLLAMPATAAQGHSRVLARKYLIARKGGFVRTSSGVELRVPAHVMRRNGVASLTEVAQGEYAVHIAAPWQGTVTVVFPLVDGLPVIAHRVLGEWRIEAAQVVNGRAIARVHQLSLFGDLAKCIKPESFHGFLICLLKAGIHHIPQTIFQKIVDKIIPAYDPCKPINFSLDITDLLVACPAVDGPPPNTPSAPQSASQSQPPPSQHPTVPSQPAPTPQPTPAPSPSPVVVYTHHVYGTCADGACGLHIRSGPGYSSYSAIGSLVDGSTVQIVCQSIGETVGPSPATGNSSAIWDKLDSGGWVSDLYIDTPNAGTWSPPIPQC